MALHAEKSGGAQVGTRTYLVVALVLAVITVLEVSVPYLGALRRAMVPLLLLLGAAKFALVAAYFMHLRFDRRPLTWVFAVGLALALVVVVAMVLVMAA